MRALPRRSDRLDFMILHGETPVGTINLSGIDLAMRAADYGILIGDDAARGHGVAQAASALVLDHAFDALGLETVKLELFRDNAAAMRLYDKLGFTDDAVQPAPRLKHGKLRDVQARSLTRVRWRTRS
jgi:RimJ/RimL family protein N-acetyltransferase